MILSKILYEAAVELETLSTSDLPNDEVETEARETLERALARLAEWRRENE